MRHALPILAAALLLAGCSAERDAPPSTAAPAAAAAAPARPAPPEFRLPLVTAAGESTLADAVKAAGGRPLVLVLGSASCGDSTRELEDLAASMPPYAVLCVVEGSPAEVRGTLPKSVPFPVAADADGGTLEAYGVSITPSVVVLDGKGGVAYQGDGGYIRPAAIADMAAKVARGEPVGEIETEGG